ncbi:hypothetical protein Ccrd_002171 [Cynara cardunculus var. scolymus]|uniref:Uncharacterized protein n=1 Tax=Cynara cardunculus var. scolymus TaxID=59895 RepID=A0A103XRT7_CYNCS|nr:hypothetical protein Ccrd_002171 [Cynara cardunculus var. scolymus]
MEAKRRLPSWMAGVSAADEVSKPLDSDEHDVITKEDVNVVTRSRKPKAKAVTQKHKKEVGLPSDRKSILVKCGTKKRGFVEKDVIEGHKPKQEVVVEKRKRGRAGRKDEEHDPSRNKEEKSYEFEGNNENQAPSDDEEDEDLTFVANNESDIDQQKPSEGRCKSSYNSSSVTTTSLVVPQDTNSPLKEETASRHDSIENTSKVALADSRMTGDPAQDMLDLFLGPLLKKPIGKEETISIKDMIFPHEVKNQQNDAVISDKPVTLTKKKSSLRDAVAMLLD